MSNYDEDVLILLSKEGEKLESLEILNRESHYRFNRYATAVDLVVIVFSSGVGFLTSINLDQFGFTNSYVALGIASLWLAVIKSISSYMQWGQKSESFRILSIRYGQLNKKIALELSLPANERCKLDDLLKIIREDIVNLENISPLIPSAVIKDYNKKYGDKYPECARPNLVNGLSKIIYNKKDIPTIQQRERKQSIELKDVVIVADAGHPDDLGMM